MQTAEGPGHDCECVGGSFGDEEHALELDGGGGCTTF